MAKIIGNTTATPNPQPDWNQTDENKADYIKNKPTILEEEVINIKQLPGVTLVSDKYWKIGAALNNLFWGENGKGNKVNVKIPADFYYLEEPVVLPNQFTLNLDNATVLIYKNQTTNTVPEAHKGEAVGLEAGKVNFCGFKLGISSSIVGGRIQNNNKYKTSPVILMDGYGYGDSILSNAQIHKTYFYNAATNQGGITLQINGTVIGATGCTVRDANFNGGNPAIKVYKGEGKSTSTSYFNNGHTIDCRINKCPTMIDLNGDGNTVILEGQVDSFSHTAPLVTPEFVSGYYYSDASDSSILTEKPADWEENFLNYYVKEIDDYYDGTLIEFKTVEQDIKSNFANDKTINQNACIVVNGVRNVITSRIYDLGNTGTTTIKTQDIDGVPTKVLSCNFPGHIIVNEQSGHSNMLYNNFTGNKSRVKGSIQEIYLEDPYFNNNIFGYAFERDLLLEVTSSNLWFYKPDTGYLRGDEVTKDFFKRLFHKSYYKMFMGLEDKTTEECELSFVLKLDSSLTMIGINFFERRSAFAKYRVELGDYQDGIFTSKVLVKESHTQSVNRIYVDYPDNRTNFQAVKFTLMGIDKSINTGEKARPISIYGTNQVSENMLIDMGGGEIFGDLVFNPETLKLKDGEGNVKSIEEKFDGLKTYIDESVANSGSSSEGGGEISENYLTQEIADERYLEDNETTIATLVNQVIATLPTWEGGSY